MFRYAPGMFPEIIIGPVLILVGAVLAVFRHHVAQIMHVGAERFFGGAVADHWFRERSAPVMMLLVGVFMIALGAFTAFEAFAG